MRFLFRARKEAPKPITLSDLGRLVFEPGEGWIAEDLGYALGFRVYVDADATGPASEQIAVISRLARESAEILNRAKAYALEQNEQATQLGDLSPYVVCIRNCAESGPSMVVEFADEEAEWIIGVEWLNEKPVGTYSDH